MILNWVEGQNKGTQCWVEKGNKCTHCGELNRLELEGCYDIDISNYNVGLPIPGFEVEVIKDND